MRRARPDDADEIADVFLASRHEALPYLPELHSDAETRAWIRGLVASSEVWVAERGSRVAAMMVLGEADGDGPAHLDHLYVGPDAQGEGLGSALLALAKKRRPDGLTLWAFQRNERARTFYERRGFRAVELTGGAGNEEREPDVRYVWEGDSRGMPPRRLEAR
jgi:ribosomal protein S18 acetylase RimI-like enzyme